MIPLQTFVLFLDGHRGIACTHILLSLVRNFRTWEGKVLGRKVLIPFMCPNFLW